MRALFLSALSCLLLVPAFGQRTTAFFARSLK
jgi:hypothetical protein